MRIAVIGAGGIGQRLLEPLCHFLNNDGQNNLVSIIDGDTFEERNRQRQQFVGLNNKAEEWVSLYGDKYRNVNFRAHPTYVQESNLSMLLQNGDFVFLCVDNHHTRKLVSTFCEDELSDVTLINGGNDLTDGNVMVYLRRKDKNVTTPLHSAEIVVDGKIVPYHPEIANPTDLHPIDQQNRQGCLERQAEDKQLLFANNMAAAMMLNAFYSVLLGVFDEGNALNVFRYSDMHFDIRSNTTRNPYKGGIR